MGAMPQPIDAHGLDIGHMPRNHAEGLEPVPTSPLRLPRGQHQRGQLGGCATNSLFTLFPGAIHRNRPQLLTMLTVIFDKVGDGGDEPKVGQDLERLPKPCCDMLRGAVHRMGLPCKLRSAVA